ncbi:Hypothetical predicted protein, partial [Olea europaea subsp. europaea]
TKVVVSLQQHSKKSGTSHQSGVAERERKARIGMTTPLRHHDLLGDDNDDWELGTDS